MNGNPTIFISHNSGGWVCKIKALANQGGISVVSAEGYLLVHTLGGRAGRQFTVASFINTF